jgi:hypothetical protein
MANHIITYHKTLKNEVVPPKEEEEKEEEEKEEEKNEEEKKKNMITKDVRSDHNPLSLLTQCNVITIKRNHPP